MPVHRHNNQVIENLVVACGAPMTGGSTDHMSAPKAEGDAQQPNQKRGGWLPKMAALIKAIDAEEWDNVEWLSQQYKHQSSMLKDLIDKY